MTRYSKTMSEALQEVSERASAKRDAMKAMGKNKGIDPADVDTDASDDDKKAASKNILMQLRKSVSMRGNHNVEFASGKHKVDAKIAQAVQDKFMKIKRPADKQAFQDKIGKSYKDLLMALKEEYEMSEAKEAYVCEDCGCEQGNADPNCSCPNDSTDLQASYWVKKESVDEGFELEEGMKMNDPKLLKMFDKLKKGSKIKLKTSSTISQGKDYVEYIVKSKNLVNKGRVEKITLATVGNEKAVKKFLYKRDGTVGFAIGDMGASIDDIKEAIDPSDTGGQEEVSMAMRQVAGIRHFVDGIEMRVKTVGDMEEWYQNKLTKAHDYLETIYSYGKGDMSEAFKPHMMYDPKTGKGYKAEKEADHLRMKDMGYTHEKPEMDESVELEEKFKVGDKVKVKKGSMKSPSQRHYEKTVGTIVKDYGDDDFKVNFGGNDNLSIEGELLVKEEVELDEAPKMKYALVGKDMKIYSMGSDERDLRLDRRSLEQRFKDAAPLKMARLKTAQSIGDKVDKSQLKEEDEPQKPDSAKEVEQGREDKKKTRIAQLQLQIAKAQETINKMNSQEK